MGVTVTQRSHPLSAQTPGCSRKWGAWGTDPVNVGEPDAHAAG